jgi:hypothetical protein
MKRTLILLTIVTVFLGNLQAQFLFNNNYQNTDGSGNWIASGMLVKNQSFYMNGGYSVINEDCNSFWSRGIFLVKINYLGEIENKVHYSNCNKSIYEGFSNSFIQFDNNFAACGMHDYNGTNLTSVYMFMFNENLDTVLCNEYKIDTTSKRVWDLIRTNDNGFALMGAIDTTHSEVSASSTFVETLLLKTNAIGDILWERKYRFYEIENYCYSFGLQMVQAYDSGYVISGVVRDVNTSMKNFILKTDSLGNQQWVRFYGNSSYDNPGFSDLIATKDSCYIVCGAYTYGETGGGYYPYDAWILKIDNDGNTKWDRKHRDSIVYDVIANDYYGFYRGVVEKDNGDLLTVCNTYSDEDSVFIGQGFRIRCLDSLGNRKWDKVITRVGNQGGPLWPQSIQLTDDNGIAVGGWAEIYYFNELEQWVSDQRIFLVKTDSLGNDTLLSDISPYEAKPITNFDLVCYPNPARNEFFIDLPQGAEDDVLEIYSTSGALVHEQTVGVFNNRVDVCNVKPGMYLVRLRRLMIFGKIVVE